MSFLPLPEIEPCCVQNVWNALCRYWAKMKKESCTYCALKSWIEGLHTIFQLLMVANCKIFFSILTCLCLKICKGHSRDWQSARENGVSQILAPIAWVMLPSFMFQVSFEHVSNPDYFSLTHRCTTHPAGGREVQWHSGSLLGPATTLQQLQACHRRSTWDKIQITDAQQMKNRNNTQGTKFLPHAMCMGLRKMTRLSAVDCQSPGRSRETEAQWNKEEYQKVRRKKTSGGRNTVTTMNHHISNCDRNYLQSAHTAPHKQQPLYI